MSSKKFNKGVSILEALVATAILAMIALFFINSNTLFMKDQQELINFNKRDRLADLIIQDISEYVKFEFNPYGVLRTTQNTNSGTMVNVSMENYNQDEPRPFPEIGDLFVVEGVNEKFKITDITNRNDGNYDLNTNKTISEELNNDFEAGQRITFISFNNTEFDCFKNPDWIDLFAESPVDDLVCDVPLDDARPEQRQGYDEVKNLINHWKNMVIDYGTQVTSAKVTVTDDNLFKVAIGKGTSETVLAKKLELCAYSTSKEIEESPGGEVTFEFPGIGPVKTAIMVGNENPVHHYYFGGTTKTSGGDTIGPYEWTDEDTTVAMSPSCNKIGASSCRKNYNNLNGVTVFLYQYMPTDGTSTYVMQPSGCKHNATKVCPLESGCDFDGDGDIDLDDNNATGWDQCAHSEAITISPGDLSLWFIYSKSGSHHNNVEGHETEGNNGYGYVGFITSNLKTDSRVLIYDDSGESCTNSISPIPGNDSLSYCEGGYDWNGAHDGLVLHLDETDATALPDIELEINIPAWNIDHWRILKSDPGEGARGDWVEQCLVAEDHVLGDGTESAHESKSDACWEKIIVNHGILTSDINAVDTTMNVGVEAEDPENAFTENDGYLRIGNELIFYENFAEIDDSGVFQFTGMKRGLRNIARISGTPGGGSGCSFSKSRWVEYSCQADDDSKIYADDDEGYQTALDNYNSLSETVNNDRTYCPLALGRWWGMLKKQSDDEMPFTGNSRTITNRKPKHFVHMKRTKFCASDNHFEVGDYFYNEVAVAASHSAGSTVYNANPKTTQASIMTVPDFDDYDDTTPKTITIPKKVTLKLTEAEVEPVTTSCGED